MQRIKTLSEYFKKYELSEKDPEKFWSEIADSFIWKKNQKTLILVFEENRETSQNYTLFWILEHCTFSIYAIF